MAMVQIYSTRWCGYCVRAKALLDARGIAYDEIALGDDPAFRQKLFDLTGGWTVPQILVDGRPIGGYTELSARPRRPPCRASRRLEARPDHELLLAALHARGSRLDGGVP